MSVQLSPSTLRDDNENVLSYKVNVMPALYELKIMASDGYEISADEGLSYGREARVRASAMQKPPRIIRTILVRKIDPAAHSGTIRHLEVGSDEDEVVLAITPGAGGSSITDDRGQGRFGDRGQGGGSERGQSGFGDRGQGGSDEKKQGMDDKRQGGLDDNRKKVPDEPPTIRLSPSSIDFEGVSPGKEDTKYFGIRTKGVKGNLDIEASEPYTLSMGSSDFQRQISLPVTADGDYKVYVRFQPAMTGGFAGKVTIGYGQQRAGEVGLHGEGKKKSYAWLAAMVALLVVIGGYFIYENWPKGGGGGGVEHYFLKLAGSNTIGDTLAQNLVTAYLKKKLGVNEADIDVKTIEKDVKEVNAVWQGKKIVVRIEAHGSPTGFKALLHNDADICMASRKINHSEDSLFMNKPVPENLQNPASEHVIGLDGIAVVVSADNYPQAMTLGQLKDIFTGFDNRYHLYVRNSQSGTTDGFMSMVGISKTVGFAKENIDSFEKSDELVNEVAGNSKGIGYISYSFTVNNGRVHVVPVVADPSIPPLLPNAVTIKSEDYPLCRELNLYTHSSDTNTQVAPFVNFVESPEGQEIVQGFGFISLEILTEHPERRNDDPQRYSDLIDSMDKLSTDIRFKTAVNELDSRAEKDIARIVRFLDLPQNKDKKVTLVGFSDNVGQIDGNVRLSLKRAERVRELLNENGVGRAPAPAIEVRAFGPARPVRSNNTEEEKAKNRRVEIWISR